MIKFTYKQITRMIDLIENEIDRVERERSRLSINTVATQMSTGILGEDPPDGYYNDGKKKYDKELDMLNQMRDNYQKELERMEFTFSIGDKEVKTASPIFQ